MNTMTGNIAYLCLYAHKDSIGVLILGVLLALVKHEKKSLHLEKSCMEKNN